MDQQDMTMELSLLALLGLLSLAAMSGASCLFILSALVVARRRDEPAGHGPHAQPGSSP
jgi:hypothetical protein